MYNIFIEGIQGAGKSTLANQFQKELPDYKVFREGDLSPVDLAWCAYMTEKDYNRVQEEYPFLTCELDAYTVTEKKRKITAYTKILTDAPGFHKYMEQFEIYNGNIAFQKFEDIILERYRCWNGTNQIFECALFQNSIECMMLFYQMSDEEIINFYKKIYVILKKQSFRLIYLDVADIEQTIMEIKRERVDSSGEEVWYSLVIKFLEESPYGQKYNLIGMNGLVFHLKKRRLLERKIINELFKLETIYVESKNYFLDDIIQELAK